MSEELRCPTCERRVPPPRVWYDGLFIWANIVLMATATFLFIEVPTVFPSIVASCGKYANAEAGNLSACYGYTGTWLFLGCLGLVAAYVLTAVAVYAGVLRSRDSRARYARIRPRLEADHERTPWYGRW
jgi:hypothetical protein